MLPQRRASFILSYLSWTDERASVGCWILSQGTLVLLLAWTGPLTGDSSSFVPYYLDHSHSGLMDELNCRREEKTTSARSTPRTNNDS
jgi:hypothetical protein